MNERASISQETPDFLHNSVIPLMQAYGLSESCGTITFLSPGLAQTGADGLPVPSMGIGFLVAPEARRSSQGKPPTGEICVRGPSVSKEYFKRPNLDSDKMIFTKDGWFRTGNVGQWNQDGTISLIDCVKILIKLQRGEYITLEYLETTCKPCDLVSHICLYASAEAMQSLTIIVPHKHNLQQSLPLLCPNTLSSTALANRCNNDDVKAKILQERIALWKKNGFR